MQVTTCRQPVMSRPDGGKSSASRRITERVECKSSDLCRALQGNRFIRPFKVSHHLPFRVARSRPRHVHEPSTLLLPPCSLNQDCRSSSPRYPMHQCRTCRIRVAQPLARGPRRAGQGYQPAATGPSVRELPRNYSCSSPSTLSYSSTSSLLVSRYHDSIELGPLVTSS